MDITKSASGRSDDEERVIRHRLVVFATQTRPVIDTIGSAVAWSSSTPSARPR
jgi:adenylate kinase family enzyme